MKTITVVIGIVAVVLGMVMTDFALAASLPRMKILPCPRGARPMYRPDGEVRKCLPHQTNLCLNALDDNTDPSSVCCWHNQVDYHCCMNVETSQCPQYNNVTVVIHNSLTPNAFPVRSFHFRKGIEDEIDFAQK